MEIARKRQEFPTSTDQAGFAEPNSRLRRLVLRAGLEDMYRRVRRLARPGLIWLLLVAFPHASTAGSEAGLVQTAKLLYASAADMPDTEKLERYRAIQKILDEIASDYPASDAAVRILLKDTLDGIDIGEIADFLEKADQAGAVVPVAPVGSGQLSISATFFDPGYPDAWDPPAQHLGIDLPADTGTLVRSPIAGKVLHNRTDRSDNFNKYLIIKDEAEGLEHVFAHLDSDLQPNSEVRVGDTIGSIVKAGTGPHLHWGINNKSIVENISGDWGFGRAPLSATMEDAMARGWIDPAAWYANKTGFEQQPAPAPPGNFDVADLKDGLYGRASDNCSINANTVGDRWYTHFRFIRKPEFSGGYEVSCSVKDSKQDPKGVLISATCSGEGNFFDRTYRWNISSPTTFTDVDAYGGPVEFQLCEDDTTPTEQGLEWTDKIVEQFDIRLYRPCEDDRTEKCLRALGYSEGTIEFVVSAWPKVDFAAVPREFKELGKVDVVNVDHPYWEWTTLLVNTSPQGVERPTFPTRELTNLPNGAIERSLIRRFPESEGWNELIKGHRRLPSGGQRFTLETIYTSGCRACKWIGGAVAQVDFDRSGREVGWKYLGMLDRTDLGEILNRSGEGPLQVFSSDLLSKRPKLIQYLLNIRGYDAGEMDGAFGVKTQSALSDFQRENRINTGTGHLDQATLVALSDLDTLFTNGTSPQHPSTEEQDATSFSKNVVLTWGGNEQGIVGSFTVDGVMKEEGLLLTLRDATGRYNPDAKFNPVDPNSNIRLLMSASPKKLCKDCKPKESFSSGFGLTFRGRTLSGPHTDMTLLVPNASLEANDVIGIALRGTDERIYITDLTLNAKALLKMPRRSNTGLQEARPNESSIHGAMPPNVSGNPMLPVSIPAATRQDEDALSLKKAETAEIQARLLATGFDPNGIDGVMGKGTRSALRTWQNVQGVSPTGYLNAAQLEHLKATSQAAFGLWSQEPENAEVLAKAARERKKRLVRVCKRNGIGILYDCRKVWR